MMSSFLVIFWPLPPQCHHLRLSHQFLIDIFDPPPSLLKNDDVIYGWPLTTHLGTQNTNCALSLEHFDSKSWCNLAHIKQSIDTSESKYQPIKLFCNIISMITMFNLHNYLHPQILLWQYFFFILNSWCLKRQMEEYLKFLKIISSTWGSRNCAT